MKHKTWFRLALKLVGIMIVFRGISPLWIQLGFLWQTQTFSSVQIFSYTRIFYIAGPVLQISFGLYCFFGGEWIVNKAIPSNRPYCPECGYDLTGAARDRCPECDTPFDPEKVRPPSQADASDDASQ